MTMNTSVKSRKITRSHLVQALYQWQLTQASITELTQQFTPSLTKKAGDEPYFNECLHSIITQAETLDAHLSPFTHLSLVDIDPIELAILRLATYELKHRPDIPFAIVLDEALELSKNFGSIEGYKFVNGALDKVAATLRKTEYQAYHAAAQKP